MNHAANSKSLPTAPSVANVLPAVKLRHVLVQEAGPAAASCNFCATAKNAAPATLRRS